MPAVALDPITDSPLSQAATVAFSWMVVTATIASILVVAVPQSMRGVRDDVLTEPDTSFAVGFVAVFGLLVCSGLPLYVGTSLEHEMLITIGLIVATPGLIACAVLLVVGGCVGTIVVGDRLANRFGSESTPLWQSLAVGTLVVGGSQLVPILGTIVTIVVGVVGSGAIVNSGYERWRGQPLLASPTQTVARDLGARPATGPTPGEHGPEAAERSVELESRMERIPSPSGRAETREDHPRDGTRAGDDARARDPSRDGRP